MNYRETLGQVPFRNEKEALISVQDDDREQLNESGMNLTMAPVEVRKLFKDFQTKIDIYSPFTLDEMEGEGGMLGPKSPTILSTALVDGKMDLETEIVVIGSFLDKLPNLAGLARTCEIFGVKTLHVPDLSMLSLPDFLNVAMTAEKWLDIRELVVKDVNKFLETIKKEGILCS